MSQISDTTEAHRTAYREYSPCARLRTFVECYWMSTWSAASQDQECSCHRVLPDGCIDIIFDDRRTGYEQGCVVGAMSQALVLEGLSECNSIGIRFRPGAAAGFLALPCNELTDQVAALSALDSRSPIAGAADEVSGSLFEMSDEELQVSWLDRWLCGMLSDQVEVDARVCKAIELFQAVGASEPISVESVCKQLGVSRQYLGRLFRQCVGLSPKHTERVLRFQRLVAGIEKSSHAGWATIATSHGYSDQSHLIRECHDLAGSTPTALWGVRN